MNVCLFKTSRVQWSCSRSRSLPLLESFLTLNLFTGWCWILNSIQTTLSRRSGYWFNPLWCVAKTGCLSLASITEYLLVLSEHRYVWRQHFVPLDMKWCICHFVKWQIHPFISKGPTISPSISPSCPPMNLNNYWKSSVFFSDVFIERHG